MNEKEKVYNYISNLKDKDYLQSLYLIFLGKVMIQIWIWHL